MLLCRLRLVRAQRLTPALTRLSRDALRDNARRRADLDQLGTRLAAAQSARLTGLTDRLTSLERMRQTLGYGETLRRGYAVLRGEGAVLTRQADAIAAGALEIEFHDGRVEVQTRTHPKPRKGRAGPAPDQGTLF